MKIGLQRAMANISQEFSSQENEEDCKPNVSLPEVKSVLEQYFGLKGITIKQLEGYDDLNYHCLPESITNSFITTYSTHGYVLKIMNSLDSKKEELCEAQNSMMLFLRSNSLPSPVPVKNVFGAYYLKKKFMENSNKGKEHIVRLLEYQPGVKLTNIPKTYPMFYQLGMFVSRLNKILKNFFHPVYTSHTSIWHLGSVPEVKCHLNAVKDLSRRALVNQIIEQFCKNVQPKEETLEKGMIHGDFNEHNILMSRSSSGEWMVSAILDFGDSHMSYYLFELAIASCYMMMECRASDLDPLVGIGHLLAGYLTERPSFTIDYELLKLCICARFCQSLVLGLKTFELHPENKYALSSQKYGWDLLEELWKTPEQEVIEVWKSVVEAHKNKATLNYSCLIKK